MQHGEDISQEVLGLAGPSATSVDTGNPGEDGLDCECLFSVHLKAHIGFRKVYEKLVIIHIWRVFSSEFKQIYNRICSSLAALPGL